MISRRLYFIFALQFAILFSFVFASPVWANTELESCSSDSFLPANENNPGSTKRAALDYIHEKTKLLRQIAWAEKHLGRKISWSEFRRSERIMHLQQALQYDDAYLAYIHIKPLFFETYAGYFGFQALQKELLSNPLLTSTQKESLLIEKNKNAYWVAKNWDLYTGVFSYLEATAKQGSGRIQKNAQTVLDKLSAEYMMGEALKQMGLNQAKTPSLSNLWSVIEVSHEAELQVLREKRNQEFLAIVYAVSSPGKIAIKLGVKLSKLLDKIPGISSLTKRLTYSLIAEENRYLYYPSIHRVVSTEASLADKARLLALENTGTDNDLLVTFIRRVDLKKTFKEILDATEKEAQKAKDPIYADLLKNINEAKKTAKDLPELSLFGRSNALNIVKRAIDIAIAYQFTYKLGEYLKWWGGLPGSGSGAILNLKTNRKIALESFDAFEKPLDPQPEITRLTQQLQSVKSFDAKEQTVFDNYRNAFMKDAILLVRPQSL